MKVTKTLVAAALGGAAVGNNGNHSFTRIAGRNKVIFYYFMNPVCVLDLNTKTFRLDHCGYKTSSTTRTLNAYHAELTVRGFSLAYMR